MIEIIVTNSNGEKLTFAEYKDFKKARNALLVLGAVMDGRDGLKVEVDSSLHAFYGKILKNPSTPNALLRLSNRSNPHWPLSDPIWKSTLSSSTLLRWSERASTRATGATQRRASVAPQC